MSAPAGGGGEGLCPACPREAPEAYFAVEWGPEGWSLVDEHGRTFGTPLAGGLGVRPKFFKTSDAARTKAQALLRKVNPRGEIGQMCSACPYLPES